MHLVKNSDMVELVHMCIPELNVEIRITVRICYMLSIFKYD